MESYLSILAIAESTCVISFFLYCLVPMCKMLDSSVTWLVFCKLTVFFPFVLLGLIGSIVDEESDIARRKDDGSIAER